jgi:4-hydroxybenzoate polyprenyltransferase
MIRAAPSLRCLFHDEIGARLLDRREEKPQVRRVLLRRGLLRHRKAAAPLSGVGHRRAPFPVTAIEQGHLGPLTQTHHREQVIRLLPRQVDGLPFAQGMLYMEPDLGTRHEAKGMGDADGTPEGQVADAVRGNWVDTLAPVRTRPYLRLSRADRPIGTWLLLLPCWWGVMLAAAADPAGLRLFDLWIVVGCAIGAFLMRGAGCTWNDLTDRDFDAAVARTKSRPIPSGQVTPRQALGWAVIQSLLAFCILLTFNGAAIALGVLSLLPVAIYPFAKRFTWWPQVFLGIAFNWGALLAWTAHAGSLGWPAVFLYVGGIAWTLFYDTIYAHQDTEDDALIGIKSTARLFGQNTGQWLRRFLVATITLIGLGVIMALLPGGDILALVVALAGVWAMGWHMAWQLGQLDIEDPARCMALFRSNRDTGLLPALFFAAAAVL